MLNEGRALQFVRRRLTEDRGRAAIAKQSEIAPVRAPTTSAGQSPDMKNGFVGLGGVVPKRRHPVAVPDQRISK